MPNWNWRGCDMSNSSAVMFVINKYWSVEKCRLASRLLSGHCHLLLMNCGDLDGWYWFSNKSHQSVLDAAEQINKVSIIYTLYLNYYYFYIMDE